MSHKQHVLYWPGITVLEVEKFRNSIASLHEVEWVKWSGQRVLRVLSPAKSGQPPSPFGRQGGVEAYEVGGFYLPSPLLIKEGKQNRIR